MKHKFCVAAILLAVMFTFTACTSEKYMLSGTWYMQAKTPVKCVLKDDGTASFGDKEYTYKADSEDTFTFKINGDELPATMDAESTITIEGGFVLYKSYSDACIQTQEKTEESQQEEAKEKPVSETSDKEKLMGKWHSKDGKVTAVFTEKELLMTAKNGSEELTTRYALSFPDDTHIKLVKGHEIVANYDFSFYDDGTLVFKDEKGIVMEYLKEEKEKDE